MVKSNLSRTQPLTILASTVLIATLFLFLQGCVSKSTFQATVDERDQCLSSQATLKQEMAQRDAIIGKLQQERNNAGAMAVNLQGQNQRLAQMLQEERRQAALANQAYNNLVKELKVSVVAGKISVKLMKSGVTVSLPGEIVFIPGSATLSAESRQILTEIANELKELPYQTIVAGFTDSNQIGAGLIDKYPTNWELAGARAASVVRLLEKNGVDEERLVALSFGDNRPIADNDTAEGRKQNRRIEIRLRPVDFSK